MIAVDADPVTLTLGRAAYAGRPGLRFAELDLRTPGWAAALGLDREADAAVSTTALHWLSEPQLRAVYAELATVLRPGGLMLDGDHLASGQAAPTLARLERALVAREDRRRFPAGHGEGWSGWWKRWRPIRRWPLTRPNGPGGRSDAGHHGSPSGLLATHLDALRAAGFTEAGTLRQRGGNRLLCAVRG